MYINYNRRSEKYVRVTVDRAPRSVLTFRENEREKTTTTSTQRQKLKLGEDARAS